MKKVTLKIVAKFAGVSETTVWRAFRKYANDMGSIDKATRQNVLTVAKKLGYRPTLKQNLKNFYRSKEVK